MNVIEYLGKDEIIGFLDLIRSHLKLGGRLLIETPNAESPWFGAVAYGDLTHEWFFTPKKAWRIPYCCLDSPIMKPARSCISPGLTHAFAWKAISAILVLWNVVETGGSGGGIYTRVFVASATKP